MTQTYSNPDYGEKDNANNAERCLANVYLYILNIGLSSEADSLPDVDDPQDEQVEKKPDESLHSTAKSSNKSCLRC